LQATDHYSQHKIKCEQMVRASGLEWAIFRFGVVFPLAMKLDPGMFDVPLDNRLEFVHTRDVGLALANGVSSAAVWGKTLHIGGGPHCQFYYRDVVRRLLDAMGVGMLPERAFSSVPFCIDWLDTHESQALLHYQHRGLDDYARDMARLMGPRRYLIQMCRPLVRRLLLGRSPYFSAR
jgi:nucleoside-diphosphate-sugar epimerase